jgi:hypothetical protein
VNLNLFILAYSEGTALYKQEEAKGSSFETGTLKICSLSSYRPAQKLIRGRYVYIPNLRLVKYQPIPHVVMLFILVLPEGALTVCLSLQILTKLTNFMLFKKKIPHSW